VEKTELAHADACIAIVVEIQEAVESMKPRVFIGSSVESLSIAYAIQENLEYVAEVTVWDQGIFKLSSTALDSLVKAARNSDAAVFVFAPDDIAKIRQAEVPVARDNVVFELGFFMGVLGADRVYFVVPRNEQKLHLPTDLLGVTYASFEPSRSDNNLQAALGPACNKIKGQLAALKLPEKPIVPVPEPSEPKALSDDDALAVIDAWLHRSVLDVLMRPHLHAEIDEQLLLPSGTSARLTRRAVNACSRGLKVAADNGRVIQIVVRV
jgi:predicted nucleotide-binding protein